MFMIYLNIDNGKIFTLLITNQTKMTIIQPNPISLIPDSKALELRCAAKPPTQNRDRINPSGSYSAIYIDDGLWSNRISRIADVSAQVRRNLQKAEESTPHSSFDALCLEELNRRHPDGFKIGGFKGLIERTINAVMRVFGKSYTAYTDVARLKYKKQISYSACNRSDLRSKITIQDPALRETLQITSDDVLTTSHILSKNSPMNGQSYLNEKGEKITLSQGISSSSDRKSGPVGNLRRVATLTGTSIAYTGRVENKERALEGASFIFLSEMRANKQGISSAITENGEELYEMDYVVSSALSTHPIMSTKTALVPFAERKALLQEIKALKELKSRGYMEITDPEDGKTYKVRFNPVLFSEALNFLLKFEESFPPQLSGASISSKVQADGMQELRPLLEKKLHLLHSQKEASSAETNPSLQEIENKITELEKTWKLCLSDKDACSEEKLLHRDYLFKLLNLPVVYHCKSSTDRTGILIALSSALQQWRDLHLAIPEPITKLLSDYRFKELFAANLLSGHQITRYARSTEGVVNGKTSCPHILGYSFSRGLFQNPAIQKLMPERYLTAFPLDKKILLGSAVFLVHFFSLPMLALQTLWHLGKWIVSGCKKENLNSWQYIFPMVIKTSLIGSLRWIPTKILDESSPQVGERNLLSRSVPRCPDFASSCLKKLPTATASDAPFKEARTSEEYKKVLSDFKENVGVGYKEQIIDTSLFLKEGLASIKENLRLSSSYNYQNDLAALKENIFGSLSRDLERTSLVEKSRALIINGKKYGYNPSSSVSVESQIEGQVAEIYEILRQYYLQSQPALAAAEKHLELEEKILFAMDQLHQGAVAPLLQTLINQFQSDQFLLTAKNSYYLELQTDPEEILSDGSKGSLLYRRRLIAEAVAFDTLETRSSIKETNSSATPRITDQYGIPIFKNKNLRSEGLVFAECIEEIRPDQSLSIRFGVL